MPARRGRCIIVDLHGARERIHVSQLAAHLYSDTCGRKDAVPAHMGQCMKACLFNVRVSAWMLVSLFTHPYVDSCVQKGFVAAVVDRTIFLSDRHIAFG